MDVRVGLWRRLSTEHFWTVVLEKTPESSLDCKEIHPVRSEGDQPWDFFGRTDAKAETPVLWPPHAKSGLIGKDSDAGRNWGQEEKRTTEDEMIGWHQWLDGHESEWTPGVGDGQGGLACCDWWGHKESDTTEQLNCTELNILFALPFLLVHTNQSYRSYKLFAEHLEGNVQLAVGNVVLEFKGESNFRVICIYMKNYRRRSDL